MIKKIFVIFVATLIGLLISEISLRLIGIKPWKYVAINDSISGKNIFKDDPVLGWISTEDKYEVNPVDQREKIFKLTIGKNGERETGLERKNFKREILIVGGSFSQGWGVSDEDTFSAKLEKKYSDIKVHNYGQGGYGTVQSTLLLEREIKQRKLSELVIYGFIEHHEYRNVARVNWLRTLAMYSQRGTTKTPYGFINEENKLIFKKPISYVNFPFKENLSLISLIEKVFAKNMSKKGFPRDSKRKKQQKIVTEKTILKMQNIAKKNNSNFLVLILDYSNKFTIKNYESFFINNKINFVNCYIPLVDKMVLIGDYHPSKKAHSHYSECLYNYIENELKK